MKSNTAVYATAFLLSCVDIAAGNPTFQFKSTKHAHSKPTNSIMALKEDKQTIFLITDSFGIGSATILLTSGHWPKNVTLRFQHGKGRGFRRLEGFDLTTAYLQVRSGMHHSGKMPFYFPDANGMYETSESPAGEMNILVKERNGAMEVTLPANLFVGSKDVKIAWIDAYR
jgi:hypothetical protein